MKNATVALIALSALLSAPCLGGGEGTSSAKFLKADSGARASALGGAYTAVADDADAVSYNPAGMVYLHRTDEAYFTHNEWISGFRQENLAYVHNTKAGAFGLGLVYFHSGGISETDMSGNYTGAEFDQSDMAASLNYGYRHNSRLSLGVGLKVIRESLHKHSGMSGALDAGLLYDLGKLRLGFAVRNLGPGLKVYEEAFPLPLTIRGGAAYYFGDNTLFSADIEKVRDSGLALKLGGEYRMTFRKSDVLALRLGYSGARDEDAGSGLTGGLGFKVADYVVDYSFSPFGELGNAHRFSFGMAFGKAVKPAIRAAEETVPAVKARKPVMPTAKPADKPLPVESAPVQLVPDTVKPAPAEVKPLPASEANKTSSAAPEEAPVLHPDLVPETSEPVALDTDVDVAEEGTEIGEAAPESAPVEETKEECISRCVSSGTLNSVTCISKCQGLR